MFGKTILLPKCQVTSVKQLIGRWKYQLKLIIKTREKNVATNENCILRKMGLKFQNPSFNILWKIAFWNNRSGWIRSWCCSSKTAACLVNSLEKWKISLVRKFRITWNQARLHSPSQGSSISMLVHFHKMAIQMGQPIKEDRMLL